MTRLGLVLSTFLLTAQLSFAQQPAKNSEAALIGLNGSVHTVLTEWFYFLDNPDGTPTGSTFAIYDPSGYQLDEYRFEPDGSLRSHTKYTRKGWQVYKTQTESVVPTESRTFVQSFNSDGFVTSTETYDGSGSLISKTRNDFGQKSGGVTVSTSQDVKPDGGVSSIEIIDKSSATGLSGESATKDGKPYYDSLVQRDASGRPTAVAQRFADGSFHEREVKPDGTRVEHNYWAPTKTHTYQATDGNSRVLEVIDDAPGYQEDENGNWVEQRDYNLDATLPLLHWAFATVFVRSIAKKHRKTGNNLVRVDIFSSLLSDESQRIRFRSSTGGILSVRDPIELPNSLEVFP